MLEQAIKISWSRRNDQRSISPGIRELIMNKVIEQAATGDRLKPFLEISAIASRLAWAASVLAIISTIFGANALAGLELTANYLACFVFV